MSDTLIKYAGGAAEISGYSRTGNPAIDAMMAAMFSSQDLPSLNFAKTDNVQVQVGGGVAVGGSAIGV